MPRFISTVIVAIVLLVCLSSNIVSSATVRQSTLLRSRKGTDPFDPSEGDDVNAASDTIQDDEKEEQEFEKNVKIAKEDVHIKELAHNSAVLTLKHYKSDDSRMKEAKQNYTEAMEHENEIKDQMDDFNATFVESEKELQVSKNISAKAILKELSLKNQSKNANVTYKLTFINVTNLREAEAQAKIHLKDVEISDAKRQAAKVLKNALAKVKALKAVGAGHEAYEELREELASIKEHKRKKDVDHDTIFDAIKKAKDDAKRVKQLRKDLQEAEAKAHDAKEALENITRTGKLPENYAPGDAAVEFESKRSTIEQWINALDLPGKSKLKNETAKKLWNYRATKYKSALLALNASTIAEYYARNNFTLSEKQYFNSTIEALKAKHNFEIKRTAFYAERTFDIATMKEHVRATEIAARLAREKLQRMLKAEKVMRETAKKTEEAVRALRKSLETHAEFMKTVVRKPYVPPRIENGHGIDAMTDNSPLAQAAKDLVWGDVQSAEAAVHSIINNIQSKANESAIIAVARGPNTLGAQAAKVLVNHPAIKALKALNGAKSARFREVSSGSKETKGWVTPSLNDATATHVVSSTYKVKSSSNSGKKQSHHHNYHHHNHHHHHHHHNSHNHQEARFQSVGASLRGKLVTVSTSGIPNVKTTSSIKQVPQMIAPLKSQPSHCFDGKKDNGELGVDCGGSCARSCGFHRVQMVKGNKDEYHKVSLLPSKDFTAGETPQIVRKLECGKGVDCGKAKDFRPVHYTDIDAGKK